MSKFTDERKEDDPQKMRQTDRSTGIIMTKFSRKTKFTPNIKNFKIHTKVIGSNVFMEYILKKIR